jgi:hypothetical protein
MFKIIIKFDLISYYVISKNNFVNMTMVLTIYIKMRFYIYLCSNKVPNEEGIVPDIEFLLRSTTNKYEHLPIK